MVVRKSFNWQIYCKNWFFDRAFYVTRIADADIGSLKSLHTLFDKYLDHLLVKFEQKSYGPNHTKFYAFWQKMVNNFWQSVDAILKDISVTETIV